MTQFISENNLYQDNAMINFGKRPPPPPPPPPYSHININVHDNWYSMSGCVLLSTVFIPFVRS